ncbi:hypothetical protein EDB81DRAFT_339871 [Dactylonectria macrodidyma]|uniref:Uncharacterized protein n=1 Tax=Dactylonectria macrodidyma TaxID=307937 RepID=A0A9P9FGL1_9HYPO|nr:hypothetical protein EDB81DRAFT_339871 [Dactylonectria macrodidyma]
MGERKRPSQALVQGLVGRRQVGTLPLFSLGFHHQHRHDRRKNGERSKSETRPFSWACRKPNESGECLGMLNGVLNAQQGLLGPVLTGLMGCSQVDSRVLRSRPWTRPFVYPLFVFSPLRPRFEPHWDQQYLACLLDSPYPFLDNQWIAETQASWWLQPSVPGSLQGPLQSREIRYWRSSAGPAGPMSTSGSVSESSRSQNDLLERLPEAGTKRVAVNTGSCRDAPSCLCSIYLPCL